MCSSLLCPSAFATGNILGKVGLNRLQNVKFRITLATTTQIIGGSRLVSPVISQTNGGCVSSVVALQKGGCAHSRKSVLQRIWGLLASTKVARTNILGGLAKAQDRTEPL